jgi:hypothetical protein
MTPSFSIAMAVGLVFPARRGARQQASFTEGDGGSGKLGRTLLRSGNNRARREKRSQSSWHF